MDLWIRSQDKMNLVKIEQINVSYRNNKQIIANYKVLDSSTDFYQLLGEYKSKERALEVLNEIEERIMLINTFSIARDTDSLLACQKALNGEKIQGLSYPYQMPEE